VLCGGSAYGLAAADGVVRWLGERGRGFAVGARPHEVVPIVPAAALFDLPMGEWGNVPDGSFGYAACAAAGGQAVAQGSVGAGAGARAGRLKGGIGTASMVLDGNYTVGALVAANPSGEAVFEGVPFAAAFESGGEFDLRPPSRDDVEAAASRLSEAAVPNPFNTTIGVVATDAALTRSQCRRLAMAAHDGLARAVRPAHTLFDGDTVFALATGTRPVADDPVVCNALAAAAADTFARAIVHAVLSAQPAGSVPSYRQLWPSALE
jgi:L-aminopeptidase/D-esterase-like protein